MISALLDNCAFSKDSKECTSIEMKRPEHEFIKYLEIQNIVAEDESIVVCVSMSSEFWHTPWFSKLCGLSTKRID